MAIVPPNNPFEPIPNGPFETEPGYTLQAGSGQLIVGSGLAVNAPLGALTSTGGSGGGAAGLTGQVQYNIDGAFAASGAFVYDYVSGVLQLPRLYGVTQVSSPTHTSPNDSLLTLIPGPRSVINGLGSNLNIVGGPGNNTGNGGAVNILSGAAGVASTRSGNVTIRTADALVTGQTSGDITIEPGDGQAGQGSLNLLQIATASAKATYVPIAPTDLATKAYVDTGGGGGAGGPEGAIQYNSSNSFAGEAEFLFDPATTTVTISNGSIIVDNITSTLGSSLNLTPGLGGDVLISAGATAGSVQIEDITVAAAAATYIPTQPTDLATKAYVDAVGPGANTIILESEGVSYGNISTLEINGTSVDVAVSVDSGVGTVVLSRPGNSTDTCPQIVRGYTTPAEYNAAAVYLVDADLVLEGSILDLDYSSGIITNTSGSSRIFVLSAFATWDSDAATLADADQAVCMWFQKNSITPGGENAYGLNAHTGSGLSTGVLETEWVISLDSGESMSLWFGSGDFTPSDPAPLIDVGTNFNTVALPSFKLAVTELISVAGEPADFQMIEGRFLNEVLVSGTPAKLEVGFEDVTSIPFLDFDDTSRSYVNNDSSTHSFIVSVQVPFSISAPVAGDIWNSQEIYFTKNNPGATPNTQNHAGQNGFSYIAPVASNLACNISTWSFTLAPGESFQVWVGSNFTSAGGTFLAGAVGTLSFGTGNVSLDGDYASRFVIYQIDNDSLVPQGGLEARFDTGRGYGAGINNVGFYNQYNFDSESLVRETIFVPGGNDENYWVNKTDQPRTYLVSAQVALNTLLPTQIPSLWIEAGPLRAHDPTAVYGETGRPPQNTGGGSRLLVSTSAVVTVGANEAISTWVSVDANFTIGTGEFGNAEGYSTKLNIVELTAVGSVGGTITGVIANQGLTGGGFQGVVGLAVAPATTEALGGVIPDGTTITVDAAGVITAVGGGGGTPAGSDTQVQFNDNGSFGAAAAFTYDSNNFTLTVPSLVATGTIFTELIASEVAGDDLSIAPASIGTTGSTGGFLNLRGGSFGNSNPGTTGVGGGVFIQGGQGPTGGSQVSDGGSVEILGGAGNLGDPGSVSIFGGNAEGGGSTADGGDVFIDGGTSVGGVNGGIQIGLTASDIAIHLVSPNGTRYRLTVADDGTLGTTPA